MKYLLLVFVIIGAVDCVVGWYLDVQFASGLAHDYAQLFRSRQPDGFVNGGPAFYRDAAGIARDASGKILDGTDAQPTVNIPWSTERKPIRDDAFVYGDTVLQRDAASNADLWPVQKDAANTLAQRGGDPMETRLYATYTNATQYGLFRNHRGWWQFVWNGHPTPLIAPSWR